MSQANAAKINITGTSQVALVVKDLQKTIENYWNILGIGPWDVFDMCPPMFSNLTYHGKPAEFTAKIGVVQVGETQMEIIEPVSGESIYSDFLAEHGEGFHHIQSIVDDVDEMTHILKERGFPVLQSGHVGDGVFVYYDTVDALKAIWEVWQPAKEMTPSYRYPEADKQESSAKINITGISQVALVVEDLQETMENYWNIFGIGPWEFVHMRPPALSNLTYHGKPGQFTMKFGLAMLGKMQLEPVEPVSGNSIYGDFLTEHGEGLNHLMLAADDVDELAETMGHCFPILQSGHINDGIFTYYDTVDALKTIWEVWQPGKTTPVMSRYP